MKKLVTYMIIGWSALFIALLGYFDFDAQFHKLIQISDYLMTFHVAGSLVAHGQDQSLYPPVDLST